ncbi:hypothetical protein [Haladaptatus salinisoli]|uniref:hypothetical protein n=1 Tax=Haladaptatus salinisoli TaxID=2884876 RepID=UPI001D0B99DF|nr:hypothetical protein [Haladaptatus salinisoli]
MLFYQSAWQIHAAYRIRNEHVDSLSDSTAALAPLAVLTSYVIRISTIVGRMPMLAPFITDG